MRFILPDLFRFEQTSTILEEVIDAVLSVLAPV